MSHAANPAGQAPGGIRAPGTRRRQRQAAGARGGGGRSQVWSAVIGLGVPAAAIIVVLPVISGFRVTVGGLPLVYFWIFLWFPLTFGCLLISWYAFDRRRYQETEGETGHE